MREMSKCNCVDKAMEKAGLPKDELISKAVSLYGNGCRYCLPQEYIDKMLEYYDEVEKELEEELEEMKEFAKSMTRRINHGTFDNHFEVWKEVNNL
jgi:hypothetical protein